MKMAKSPSNRVWMNVTTSVNWTRPAVGIVRVEQELFKALSAALGERLQPCILADGKFIPYKGVIGTAATSRVKSDEDTFHWPDPSYDFPQAVSLDPAGLKRSKPHVRPAKVVPKQPLDGIGFGDTLISVGLDWDWQDKRLDKILYDLKTKLDVKVVTCCYDLIPVLFPQYCVGDVAAKFREYFTNLTWSSSGMLCISQRSEADYRALAGDLGMPWIPTKVMLLGNKLPEAGDDVSEQIDSLCGERFVLFVSTIERRKNHEVLYKALHILAERRALDPNLKLVFVGMPGWGVGDLLKDIELDPIVKDHIIQLNHTNDAELRMLYEACEFFVYPSLYEGWGLPVAEALAIGKFVIASDRGSIPEVGGDLVEYVDPWNATAWADVLLKYWGETELVRERTERIRREYQPVQWHETASAVLELIETVGSEQAIQTTFEPGYDLHTVNGVRYGPRIVAVDASGTLCHGPYRPLPKGPLRVAVEIENIGSEPAELKFKFCSQGGRSIILEETRYIDGAMRKNSLHFGMNLNRAVDDFEVVIFSPEKVTLSIDRIEFDVGKSDAGGNVAAAA